MITKLHIILDACIKNHGSDFTRKTRKRDTIYARAAYINIVRTKYGKKVSLTTIGKVAGGIDHATVLHAYSRTVYDKDGRYLLEPEFTTKLESFKKCIKNIMTIKDVEEIKTYTNDLIGSIERLEDEKDELKNIISKMELDKIEADKKVVRTFTDEIESLPDDIKQEFKKYKWMPYKKMLESRTHYSFKINHKPVY